METTMLGRNLVHRLTAVADLEHLRSSPQITSDGSVFAVIGGVDSLLWGGHDFPPHPHIK
jgi:hypothetical protein